jgi:hypothetical protein
MTDVSKMDIKLPRKLQEAGHTFESLSEMTDEDFVKAFEAAGVDPNKMYSDDEEGGMDADLPPEMLEQLQAALGELERGDALLQSMPNVPESAEDESAVASRRVRGRKAGQSLESDPDDDKWVMSLLLLLCCLMGALKAGWRKAMNQMTALVTALMTTLISVISAPMSRRN